MKSLRSFVIVALAVTTSVLPSVYAQDCSFACMDCKTIVGCSDDMQQVVIEECADNEACVVVTEGEKPECRPFSETPCNCNENSFGCDPYNKTVAYSCKDENLYIKPCTGIFTCVVVGFSTICVPSYADPEVTSPTTTTTTKPPTCSEDNLNKRYPHDTDCKKFYNCRKISLTTYDYVESTCTRDLVYNKDTTYCDEPENVPDCIQVKDCNR